MNKTLLSLLTVLSLVGIAHAQTNINLTPPDFFAQVPGYLTVFDTNNTLLVGSTMEINNVTIYNNGRNVVDELGGRFNFKTATAPSASFNTGFAEVKMRYAGIGGVLDGGSLAIGYSHTKWDTRISMGLSAGYSRQANLDRGAGVIEPEVFVEKVASKIAPGIGLGYPIGTRGKQSNYPDIFVRLTVPF